MEKNLWAPWRMAYIKKVNKKNKGCLFCRSLKLKKKTNIFVSSKYSFAMLNLFPYNNGHVLVAPKRHVGIIQKLTDKELMDMLKTTQGVLRLLDKVLKPQGYNVGMNIGECSGAGIPTHLHMHIVPRWRADTNFMPVISGTKVISQSLEDLYQQLIKQGRKRVKAEKK